ncbi:MAG: LacI family DNA-binding transcriptional regulator [Anaerolineales bacterium]
MATTIRHVAQKAGVGLATVSRVINHSPLVSPATRQRVLDVIAELNFVPSPTARRLSLGRTLTIAVITPFFTRPAFVERLRGVESVVADSEYDLVLYNVESSERRDHYFRSVPRRERTDGVLIISLPPRNEDVPYLSESPVPVVLIDANHPSLTGLNRMIVDDVDGGRQAVQHLIQLGHRRIGYISDGFHTPFNFTASYDRYQGYLHALELTGIPVRSDYHAQGDHGRAEAKRLALQMLCLPERPTGIFAASDTQAMGVMEAARELGLAVPDDLSVVGYDDIEVAEYLGLTTVRQLLFESGQRGVNLLLRVLSSPPGAPVCEVLPTELIVRRTTAPPR